MAKTVQVSDDNGVTWYTLPGGEGELNRESGLISDTIFGQTFESNEVGLLGWNLNGQAIYKGFAGYLADLKQVGTATGMTTEACTLVSGKTYQIDDTTKRIWDRLGAVNPLVVFDNAVDHSADVLSIDYLFGKVTFEAAYTPTGPITVTGTYFPTAVLGQGKSFTLNMTAALIDTTTFAIAQANGGYRTQDPGLRNANLEIGGLYALSSGFATVLSGRSEIIIEIDPVGDGLSIARGFYKLTTMGQSGAVGALEEESLNFTLNVPVEDALPVDIPFGWEFDASSAIPAAVQKSIEAWQAETKLDVRYLPDGVAGDTGDAVVNNFTMSGGLEQMNEFTAVYSGDGATTPV